jgi:hypothetical protein
MWKRVLKETIGVWLVFLLASPAYAVDQIDGVVVTKGEIDNAKAAEVPLKCVANPSK